MPHELSKNNKENRLKLLQHLACHQATRDHKQRFLFPIITGDEKWCLYKYEAKKGMVASGDTLKPGVKPDLHPRKPKELYIAQVHGAIRLKRPHRQGQTILLHNNARPHVAQVVKNCTPRAQMGNLSASAVFSGPCTHGFLSFPLKTGSTNSSIADPGSFGETASTNMLRWEEVINNNRESIIY